MPDLVSPIRGKVARILSSRELALNVGSLHGSKWAWVLTSLIPRVSKSSIQ